MLPCLIFEDDHLLVVNKPAGWNTHAPAPHAGEGIYDWLRHREPRWAALAIIHRLDKETSGLLVFGKTPLANKSLTQQFTQRTVHKKYLLLTDRPVKPGKLVAKTNIARAGDYYVNSPNGEPAETHFELAGPCTLHPAPCTLLAALPQTGRTHQIRVHAAGLGFPILGDVLYGGTPFRRVCLHAQELKFRHPATDKEVTFTAPVDFAADTSTALRAAIIEPAQTDAFRVIHGASDDQPGWYVDQLGDFLLSQSEKPLNQIAPDAFKRFSLSHPMDPSLAGAGEGGRRPGEGCGDKTISCGEGRGEGQVQGLFEEKQSITGIYHKILTRRVQHSSPTETCPQPALGKTAPEKFVIHENSAKFELSFAEGYSVGLFLDQRDNRRRLLTSHIAADFDLGPWTLDLGLLNCFAYTCGFSVCAALAGAKTTSLDLSKKYLDWGKRNFTLNGLDPAAHDFIFGDTFDWLRRFAKKGRQFDAIILDPPTFSRSDEGVFRAEKDYGKLVTTALPVLKSGGVLLASTNAATLEPEDFLKDIGEAIRGAGRKVLKQHYVPQPPDFPISREEPAYLKTVWLKVK